MFPAVRPSSWFSTSPEQQDKFAALQLRSYTNGLTDSGKLREFAINVVFAVVESESRGPEADVNGTIALAP